METGGCLGERSARGSQQGEVVFGRRREPSPGNCRVTDLVEMPGACWVMLRVRGCGRPREAVREQVESGSGVPRVVKAACQGATRGELAVEALKRARSSGQLYKRTRWESWTGEEMPGPAGPRDQQLGVRDAAALSGMGTETRVESGFWASESIAESLGGGWSRSPWGGQLPLA